MNKGHALGIIINLVDELLVEMRGKDGYENVPEALDVLREDARFEQSVFCTKTYKYSGGEPEEVFTYHCCDECQTYSFPTHDYEDLIEVVKPKGFACEWCGSSEGFSTD